MNKTFFLLAAFSMQVGCKASSVPAPSYVEVNTNPTAYSISWNTELNDIDRQGKLLYFDVFANQNNNPKWQGSQSDIPAEYVQVEVTSLYEYVYILPQEAVELVSYPGLPGNVQSMEDVRDQCTDEFGNYSHDAGDWCAWYWDTSTNQYYQFSNTYADSYTALDDTAICEDNEDCYYYYGPTHIIGQTDNRGLLRVYAFVDSLPSTSDGAGASFSEIGILVTTGYSSTQLTIGQGE